ncbi:putative tetratricopeptide [Colletotrichum karsti]|uniref:Tetratricopeptide n=1 Tax=Colletotrichum karsti TaxID=1095194 RepID=A0A9P6I8S2_9PEZI|nr:putative tetratricopeptide [Colletotrichum karsti]KAF9878329.1 putative tetratricopeptide [Colletotrichum karsti]
MASTSASPDSAAARERGNDFYRKGNFAEAEKAYNEAASLAPEDPAPWSNISAIKFEQGDYSASLKNIEKALSLTASESDDEPKKQKLYTRMVKCHLHSNSLDSAEDAVKYLSRDAPSDSLRASLEGMKKLLESAPDEDKLRKQTLDRVTRYKGSLQDAPEYYAMGHDLAEPLFDASLMSAVGPKDDISFLLCGSGDARHLFASIAHLGLTEMMRQQGPGVDKQSFGRVHFTILDINPAALARTLVMFDMIFQYIILKAKRLPRIEDALTCMAYVYSSAFIPPFVLMKLMEHIRTLIDRLEEGGDVLGLIYVPEDTRAQVIRKLKQWTEDLGEQYAPKKIRAPLLANFHKTDEQKKKVFGEDPVDKQKEIEERQRDFKEFGVVFANDVFIGRREPELGALLEAFRSGAPEAKKNLEQHIDANWKTNPTVLDMDYEPRRHEEVDPSAPSYELLPTLDWDPTSLIHNLSIPVKDAEKNDVIKSLEEFFDYLCVATMSLTDRMDIEVISGEMADVLDRIRYNKLEHRLQKPSSPDGLDATKFPRQYDRIHMSNIPDYIGGPLAALLYGGPVLREDRPSNLRFNNLLNPPMFDSHDHFLAEYMLMSDTKQVSDHFGLVREKDANAPAVPEDFMKMLMGNTFMAENYFVWARSGTKRIPSNRMMPRSSLEHWLYGHLLKICLPYPRPTWSDRPVHAPLNLTAFLRIVNRMHEVGYPAHWLSGILSAVCEGNITTTARAPREIVMHPESLTKYAQRKMSLSPWRAEFTTLLSLWRRLLPFGVIVPEHTLVPAEEIIECTITFPKFHEYQRRVMHFALAFVDDSKVDASQPDLRKLLLEDEEGDASDTAANFREKGIHLVTAFKFVTDTRTATFWMRKDVVDHITQGGSWSASIYRTDNWETLLDTIVPAAPALRRLGPWTRA